MPEGIKRAILHRIHSAGPTSRRLLEAGAVLGDGFHVDDAARLAEVSIQQALDTLEQVEARQLVVHRLRDFAVLSGARMLLWQKALAARNGNARAITEFAWWAEALEQLV